MPDKTVIVGWTGHGGSVPVYGTEHYKKEKKNRSRRSKKGTKPPENAVDVDTAVAKFMGKAK